MAMEKHYTLRDTHTRALTAIGYNPARREILIGCEDGVIKFWEAEAGKLVMTAYEHKGWVTDFLFWASPKLMLSAANDGNIIAWSTGGTVCDKIPIGMPVYCMAINYRREQLVCGVNGSVRVYDLDEDKESGHVINTEVLYVAREHTDIVRCILCHESRIYSAGYDQKIVIYDSSYTRDNSLAPLHQHPKAHDAGICCMRLEKDHENNQWLMTGSFDKTVKIWSIDGKFTHKLDNFLATISGICYVPRNKTVWVAGGTSYASLFDPKSGDNVSDFIGTFQQQEEEKYQLQILKYIPELNEVIASTSRRHLVVWKYNPSGCITALKCSSNLESLCYTKKVPILIFSGDNEGVIIKWERMQSNHFMYSKELYQLSDNKLKKQKKVGSKARELLLEQQLNQSPSKLYHDTQSSKVEAAKQKINNVRSHYAYNKPLIPPPSVHNHPNTTILKIVFVERFDYIIAASEDSNIYVWAFDSDAVKALKDMKPMDMEKLVAKYSILLDPDSELLPQNRPNTLEVETADEEEEEISSVKSESDSVTNRVAGFVCKFVFAEHMSCVTSMVVIGKEHGMDTTYLLSGGWDKRICIWDLEKGTLEGTFRNTAPGASYESLEFACDGVILDMDYSPKHKEFAYASSDKMVYIRKFSTNGAKMTLVNTLQGHEGEVTCVRWNIHGKGSWVTGSEDGTIRIWSGSGLNECEQILAAQGGVCCMCIDKLNGSIVAGIQNTIRVYDCEHYRLVQTNVGHIDAVRSIIHIPERNQYVSCSWDQTIRVWNAWKKPKRRVIPKNDNKHMTLNSGDGDKPTTSGSEKKVAFSDIDGEEEMAKIPEEDEEDLQVEEV
uniref:Vegetative incompatibility protein HET-E-1 n=1 Tax=Magallana gigas TaxID=29159 RepID=K1R128_MAGGI|eukprot:XP_011437175.1 PREDICTED: uncharacterized protein LOC105335121 isoform X1 [Crassostrea gigas]